MVAWLKTHWSQILVGLLSVLVALGLHSGKLTVDQAIAIGSALGLVGIHLPKVVYSVRAQKALAVPPLPTLLAVALAATVLHVAACAAPVVAKTQYNADLKACVDTGATRVDVDNCIANQQTRWNEAGAPPALAADGGAP